MLKRQQPFEVSSCNDPICLICTDSDVSHLRAIGTQFSETWVSYNNEGEHPLTYQANHREQVTTWKVKGYYKGSDGTWHEKLERIYN